MLQLQNSIQWTCHFVCTTAKIQFSPRGAKMSQFSLSNPQFLSHLIQKPLPEQPLLKWNVQFAFAKLKTRRLEGILFISSVRKYNFLHLILLAKNFIKHKPIIIKQRSNQNKILFLCTFEISESNNSGTSYYSRQRSMQQNQTPQGPQVAINNEEITVGSCKQKGQIIFICTVYRRILKFSSDNSILPSQVERIFL